MSEDPAGWGRMLDFSSLPALPDSALRHAARRNRHNPLGLAGVSLRACRFVPAPSAPPPQTPNPSLAVSPVSVVAGGSWGRSAGTVTPFTSTTPASPTTPGAMGERSGRDAVKDRWMATPGTPVTPVTAGVVGGGSWSGEGLGMLLGTLSPVRVLDLYAFAQQPQGWYEKLGLGGYLKQLYSLELGGTFLTDDSLSELAAGAIAAARPPMTPEAAAAARAAARWRIPAAARPIPPPPSAAARAAAAPALTALRCADSSSLGIGHSSSSGGGLAALMACTPCLRVLSLRGCSGLRDNALLAGLDALAAAVAAVGTGSTVASGGSGLERTGSSARRGVGLETVDLCGARGLGAGALASVAARGGGFLATLDLSLCDAVDDTVLRGIALSCPNLTSLSLLSAPLVTDAGVAALARGCTTLARLSLARCLQITDTSTTSLANCPAAAAGYLRFLALEHLALTPATALAIISTLECPAPAAAGDTNAAGTGSQREGNEPRAEIGGERGLAASLRWLSLRGCEDVTPAAVGQILRACTNLVFLDVAGCAAAAVAVPGGVAAARAEVLEIAALTGAAPSSPAREVRLHADTPTGGHRRSMASAFLSPLRRAGTARRLSTCVGARANAAAAESPDKTLPGTEGEAAGRPVPYFSFDTLPPAPRPESTDQLSPPRRRTRRASSLIPGPPVAPTNSGSAGAGSALWARLRGAGGLEQVKGIEN